MRHLLSLQVAVCVFCAPAFANYVQTRPTDRDYSSLRGGPGKFGAKRNSGIPHAGVDLVAIASSTDRNRYAVHAVHEGTIAYAALNQTPDKPGYGYTIIVDHDDGAYSLYAHLAALASGGLRHVGDYVQAGDVIGYMSDPATGELSSGNVVDCKVLPHEKIQLHFEIFTAEKGRKKGLIKDMKSGGMEVDPTAELASLGYIELPPPSDPDKKQKEQQCKAEANQ